MVEMLHMLAQSWPNFKNLESLHQLSYTVKIQKKAYSFHVLGYLK